MVVIVFFRCSFFEHFQLGISIRVLTGLCSLCIFFLLFYSTSSAYPPKVIKNHLGDLIAYFAERSLVLDLFEKSSKDRRTICNAESQRFVPEGELSLFSRRAVATVDT